jgi:hypothetical protein
VLSGVRQAYLDGFHGGWALGIAAFGVAFRVALGPEWPGRLSTATKELSDDNQDVGVEGKSDC